MEKNMIVKSNSLIEASFKLNANQQKFIYVLTSIINKDDEDFKTYEIKVKDLVDILGISSKNIYREIDNITDQLMTKILKIYKVTDKDKLQIDKMTWFSKVSYVYGDGIVKARFDADLKPYLLKLKERFTKYELKNILNMKSQYSMRIYELLKQYETIGYRVLEIERMKEILGIEDKYKMYHQFKQRILNVAYQEINENTDINFEFEEIKKGRKVDKIKFIIKSNKNIKEINRKNNIVELEVAATIQEDTLSEEDLNIQKLKSFIKEDLSIEEYKAILNVANNDISKIEEKYEVAKASNYNNLMAFLISAIVGDYKMPIKNDNTNNANKFNNFKQRTDKYSADELENIVRRKKQ